MVAFRPLVIAMLSIFGMLLTVPALSELPKDLTALSPEGRIELSESYYLVGLQYQAVGKLEMAVSMTKLAFSLNPDLDPKKISEQTRRTVDDFPIPVITKVVETDLNTSWYSQVVISRLLRLASELLTEDADAAVALLDGSVYLSGPGTLGLDVTRAQAHRELSGLFERVSLADLTLAEIYDTNSVVAEPYPGASKSLSDAFQVRVTALADLSSDIPFWAAEQRFVLRPVADSWIVTAMLFGAVQQPPSHWLPATIELSPAKEESIHAAAAQMQDAANRQAVADALFHGIDRFLEKDAAGVLSVVASEILLPGGSTLTTKTLRKRMESYFARTRYRALRSQDAITVRTVTLLEPSPDSTVQYRAEISFEKQYQEALPSLSPGQRFDLQNFDGQWLVVAIS